MRRVGAACNMRPDAARDMAFIFSTMKIVLTRPARLDFMDDSNIEYRHERVYGYVYLRIIARFIGV